MKKKLTSLFAAMLAVIMLVTAIPVFGMETTTVTEVEELREENVKHFEMTDGTYKAVVYSDAVHRKDADGVWQDIDNTLEAVKENGNTNYKTSDGRIKFSKNIKNGKIFELSENGYKISLSLSNKSLKDSNADVKNHKAKGSVSVFDSEEEQLEKLKNVDNLTKVRYNNIEDGIDLEYQIYSNNLKESIIVNSKKDSYVYSFELKLNKLTAALNEDGSISLKDEETGESKYTMPAPFMFDNAGELSTDVSYTLTQSGKYKYTLTVTADTEWIINEARELPVTIDPSVEVDNSYGEAYVSSANPNTNYKKPSNGVLYLSSTQRIFLKFDIPEMPEFGSVTSATLITQFYFYSSTGNMSIAAYQVPYSWDEDTITWNNSVASHQSAENSATTLSSNNISSSMT
ncbi:MAG: DNRLRE domain-containing protein, partial [Clostridia bacterium]|nr:DNRLRE domain-containing protein [Clostridia bacterium]